MKLFNVWKSTKNDAHEVAHGLTMSELCERLGVSRQAIYDSLNKGVLIKNAYTVHYEDEGDTLLDYMDGKNYSFAIYDKHTDTIYHDFNGSVVLTDKGLAMFEDVLTAPIEIVSDEEQSYIIVDTEKRAMLRHLMSVLNGLTSDEGLYIDTETNDDTRVVRVSYHEVTTYNHITGEVITIKTPYFLITK